MITYPPSKKVGFLMLDEFPDEPTQSRIYSLSETNASLLAPSGGLFTYNGSGWVCLNAPVYNLGLWTASPTGALIPGVTYTAISPASITSWANLTVSTDGDAIVIVDTASASVIADLASGTDILGGADTWDWSGLSGKAKLVITRYGDNYLWSLENIEASS